MVAGGGHGLDVAGLLEKVGSPVVAAAALVTTWARRRRARSRKQELVWDEILGHEEAPGVPYKPSLSRRMQTVETKVAEHSADDLEAQRQTYAALRGLARAAGVPDAVPPYTPPPRRSSSSSS